MKMSAHHCVEVAVDHDWVSSSQVDVLFPPITHLLTHNDMPVSLQVSKGL